MDNEENVVATFWISGNTPSSKNARVWTGSNFIPSAYTRRWIRETKHEWIEQRDKFKEALKGLEPPYFIEFTFIRKSKHKFDYINIAQGPCDQMKDFMWLTDDDMDNIKPYFGDYEYNKRNPGMKIKILKTKPNHYDLQTHKGAS